jgi:hypothetical protein
MTPGFHFHSPAPIGLHTHSGPDVLHRSLCKGLFFLIFFFLYIRKEKKSLTRGHVELWRTLGP